MSCFGFKKDLIPPRPAVSFVLKTMYEKGLQGHPPP